jgi:hypothetical protein
MRCATLDTPTFVFRWRTRPITCFCSFVLSVFLDSGGWRHARNARPDGADRISIGTRLGMEVHLSFRRYIYVATGLPNTIYNSGCQFELITPSLLNSVPVSHVNWHLMGTSQLTDQLRIRSRRVWVI